MGMNKQTTTTNKDNKMTNQKLMTKLSELKINYFGETPKLWEKNGFARIYFGRDYVTIEANGEVHNRRAGKARAKTIGWEITEKIEEIRKS